MNGQINRIVYFDHLRVFATFAVIIIHVTAQNWYRADVNGFVCNNPAAQQPFRIDFKHIVTKIIIHQYDFAGRKPGMIYIHNHGLRLSESLMEVIRK